MLYTPALTLTAAGMQLAAACLLDRLASFESTQLAGYGYTGLPLMAGCVAAGGGRYSGLIIREARKAYGAQRQVEGPADRSRPVVVIDDSLSAGTSFRQAARSLEADGFRVEGTIALVHFPYRGGVEWARALGYRVETLLDVWSDLRMPIPEFVPGFRRIPLTWATDRVPDGLHPAEAARLVAEHYTRTGLALLPPLSLDRDVGGEGGVFVSFRDARTDERLARDGFWHFDASDAQPTRDLVMATVRTVQTSRGAITLGHLPYLKIAVSFFGPLRSVTPSQADFDRYGVVVRSRYWPTKVGGALPNTQVFTSEQEQLAHARRTNAGVTDFEPHELFIHDIVKTVQPGATWPPFGAWEGDAQAWREDDEIGRVLTTRAWEALEWLGGHGQLSSTSLGEELIPAPVAAVAVTLYDRGTAGCGVAWRTRSLDEALLAATRGAYRDRRYVADPAAAARSSRTLVVSVLHDRERLGDTSPDKVGRKMRAGLDSISVHQGAHEAVYLDSVVPYFNWSTEHAARQLLGKAGITKGSVSWFTYRTTSWTGPDAVHRLHAGFNRPMPTRLLDPGTIAVLLDRTASFLHRGIAEDDLPLYCSYPVSGTEVRSGTAARLTHALAALGAAGDLAERPDWQAASTMGLRRCLGGIVDDGTGARLALPGHRCSRLGDLALVEAVAMACDRELCLDPRLGLLGAQLRRYVQPDGRIADAVGEPIRQEQDHDYLPGVAVCAFARAFLATGDETFRLDWNPPLTFYRRRWESMHPWGLLAWHLQAWSAVHRIEPADRYAEFVFLMADWALDRQLLKNGAFITDMAPVPSFHTAFVAEGIADAWALAIRVGETSRARRYEESWQAAIRFMRRLVVDTHDTFGLRAGERAVGAVRGTESSSDCRVDYTSHLVMALVKGLQAMHE